MSHHYSLTVWRFTDHDGMAWNMASQTYNQCISKVQRQSRSYTHKNEENQEIPFCFTEFCIYKRHISRHYQPVQDAVVINNTVGPILLSRHL